MSTGKTGRRLGGLAFLIVLALLAWLSLAIYNKRFATADLITLRTDNVGNEMNLGAEVMVRGVQIGEVTRISSDGHGASLLLAIKPAIARELPANVEAEMLPTTLFGERYVDLILPQSPVATRLADIRMIGQAHSRDAIELQRVFDQLLPLLRAVQPEQLSVALTAIAQGLRGRGREFGQSLLELNQVLGKLDPELPALDADISELAGFATSFSQATPNLLAALHDFTVTSQTIVTEREQLAGLYPTVRTAAANFAAFLRANKGNIIHLSVGSTAVLRALARYAPEFPCTLASLVRFEPEINKALGEGTRQPGVHVIAHVVPPRSPYKPVTDAPKFTRNTGPRCESVTTAATSGETVKELTGLALGERPDAVPGWSGLLTGPVFRGRTVTLGDRAG
ncbi:MAG TPA: MCE family protein [Streptosporangiaceae bacterium]|nr:MCE family protein [Streptosporangiaceae bacterium]